jgi:dTMP kinase
MFSGKTSLLINVCAQNDRVLAFKPAIDTRYTDKAVLVSHNRIEVDAVLVSVDEPQLILKTLMKPSYSSITHVVIDEINFFTDQIIKVIQDLIKKGVHVTVAGLLLDSEKKDFGPTRALLARADIETRLFSRCDKLGCTRPAEFSYARKAKDTQVLVGATDLYGAACSEHYDELQVNKTPRGVLISFEGGEGAGKSIQIKRLQDRLLSELKRESVVLREPGGTTISEQIREILLNPTNVGMGYSTEVLLFQAARAQIYQEIVLPSLQVGKVVLMDRTRDSSVVYQGMVRRFGVNLVEQLNDVSTKNTRPNLTFLLDVPVDLGLSRRNGSGKMDRLDMEKKEFHEQVRQAYLELAREDKAGRWQVIDASKSVDEVEHDIWKIVSGRLELK